MAELTLFLRGARLDAGITAREFFNAAGGIDELLFAGKKRMAGRADTNLDIAFRGTGMVSRAASAVDVGLDVIGVNICFHGGKRELDSSGVHYNGK